MSRDLADLAPYVAEVAKELLAACYAKGLFLIITQTKRTVAEQQALYDQGRIRDGKIVTNARPGDSPHCPPNDFPALAFDVAFKVPESGIVTWEPPEGRSWFEVGRIGESLGLVWGGSWKGFPDRPHFEWADWRQVAAGGDPTGGSVASGGGS